MHNKRSTDNKFVGKNLLKGHPSRGRGMPFYFRGKNDYSNIVDTYTEREKNVTGAAKSTIINQ